MSSPCRTREILACAALALSLAACGRQAPSPAPVEEGQGDRTVVTTLFPGGVAPPADPRGAQYEGDPFHIANGKRMFAWYNCSGCHFNGAGGIGPALMDDKWIYGGRIDEIHNSIAQGRPNGMPSWRAKIPDDQIWDIAAYVKSLSVPSTDNPNEPVVEPPSAPAEAGAKPPR